MKVKCKTTARGLSLMALSALTLMSAAQADYNSSKNHDERRGHNKTKAMQQDQVITPAAGPRVNNGADFFVSADFIYWRMTQDESLFAFTGVQTNTATLNGSADGAYNDVPQGQFYSSGNDWAPGFKVGVGLNTSHDGWGVYAEYTWVRFDNSASVNQASFENADSTLIDPVSPIPEAFLGNVKSATGRTTLSYNKINLEFGRNSHLSQYLTARPHAGITSVWLTNHIRNTSGGTGNTAATTPVTWGPYGSTTTAQVDGFNVNNARSRNWGLGARAGFDFGWHFNKEWSIYSAFTGNAIWNRYSSNTYTNAVQGTVTSVVGADASVSAGDPVNKTTVSYGQQSGQSKINYVVESELGLCWKTFFYDDNYHFAAKIGWEMQDWINYMQTPDGTTFIDADLMLHGLNVQLRFDF